MCVRAIVVGGGLVSAFHVLKRGGWASHGLRKFLVPIASSDYVVKKTITQRCHLFGSYVTAVACGLIELVHVCCWTTSSRSTLWALRVCDRDHRENHDLSRAYDLDTLKSVQC